MKRKKTSAPQRSDIAEIVRQVQDYRPAKGDFNYAERGRAVTEAHRLYNESFQLGKIYPLAPDLAEANQEAHRLWFEALDRAYPAGFWEDYKRLRSGDPAGIENAVSFLEADPWFFGTGYVKTTLMRSLKPAMLTPEYKKRLQGVVLTVVDKRDERDFREYCRLARKVDGPGLREGLAQRLTSRSPDTSPNRDVRRRARWVLDALAQKDQMEAAVQKKQRHVRRSQEEEAQ